MSTPTEIQRIVNIQKSFEQIQNSNDLNKIIKYFKKNQNQISYDKYITGYLSTQIDLSYQYQNDSITNIYLLDDDYTILAFYKNGQFSTYDDYINGIIFSTLSEEQEFLNNLNILQTTKKVNVNLLQEPIANLILSIYDSSSVLYYLVSSQSNNKPDNEPDNKFNNKFNKNKCYPNYSLVSFIYKTFIV